MSEIYIVYLYCDYFKQVNFQHIKAYQSRDEAIEYAKRYSNNIGRKRRYYTSMKGTEYDAELFSLDDDNEEYSVDINYRSRKEIKEKYLQLMNELNINSDMHYNRIAVDKLLLY